MQKAFTKVYPYSTHVVYLHIMHHTYYLLSVKDTSQSLYINLNTNPLTADLTILIKRYMRCLTISLICLIFQFKKQTWHDYFDIDTTPGTLLQLDQPRIDYLSHINTNNNNETMRRDDG